MAAFETQTLNTHNKTSVLSTGIHLKLCAIQAKQLTQTHSLNHLKVQSEPTQTYKSHNPLNNNCTSIIISGLHITPEQCKENLKHIHTTFTSQ